MKLVPHRTVITIDVPIEHRYAVGDSVYRQEKPVPGFRPEGWVEARDNRSVWRVIEVGYSIGTGPYYRLSPVNDLARFKTMDVHGRVSRRALPLVDLLGPVTERVSTVDRQCEPYDTVESR